MNMLIFDGAYIKCFSLQAEIQIMAQCARCTENAVPLEVKSWSSMLPLTCPRLALRYGFAAVRDDEALVWAYPNCLMNVVASSCPACDVSFCVDCDEALSAETFNAAILHSSQRNTGTGFFWFTSATIRSSWSRKRLSRSSLNTPSRVGKDTGMVSNLFRTMSSASWMSMLEANAWKCL